MRAMGGKMKKGDFRTGSVRGEEGFTLIEIIVAIMLLVVALLGMASVTTMVIKGNSFSKMMTTATTLAQDKMEDLNDTRYTALPVGVATDYATVRGTVQASATGAYFRRSSTVTANSPAANMKSISVTVSWPQPSPTHSVTVNTIVGAGN